MQPLGEYQAGTFVLRENSFLLSISQMSPSQRNFIFHKAEVQNINDHF